jgi:AmmeMemoRadiSam system protein A
MMAGCFVSIHKSDGALRGCIGTLSPVTGNLASEILQNAVSSATRDPRFPPIEPEELDELVITVDVLGEAEATTTEELDPKRYGVIVQHGWKKGVLLPDLEGVDTVDEQLRIALMKAGISKGESYRIYRFTVKRYH